MASFSLANDSYAESNVIVGYDYTDVINPDGSHTWNNHIPYILDGDNYVPYIQTGNTIDSVIGTVTLNDNGSYTWNDKFTDRIIAKYSDVSDQVN